AVALDDEAPDVAVDGQLHFLGPGSGWAHQGQRCAAKQAGRQRPGEAVDIAAHADISGIQRRALGQHYQADAVGDHVGLQYVRLGRGRHDDGDGAVVVGVFDAGGYRVEWPRPAPGQLHRQVGLSGRAPGSTRAAVDRLDNPRWRDVPEVEVHHRRGAGRVALAAEVEDQRSVARHVQTTLHLQRSVIPGAELIHALISRRGAGVLELRRWVVGHRYAPVGWADTVIPGASQAHILDRHPPEC